MEIKINPSWAKVLREEFEKEYFINLTKQVKEEYKKSAVFPPPKYIFRAFDECSFDDVKVVILGQDPYHGDGQANGLCFSVNEGVRNPPSLQNIYKEIENDLGIEASGRNGDLTNWARQGVFLLNATLTVRKNEPTSHSGIGWERFTDAVIEILSDKKENLVFILWGAYARKKIELINKGRGHLILEAAHPSPFSADKGFFGCRHFGKANEFLASKGLDIINW